MGRLIPQMLSQKWLLSAKKALRLALLPLAELVILRLYLHFGLALRIGFPGMTDYDFFIPGAVGFFLFIYAMEEGRTLKCQFRPKTFGINFLLIVLFLGLNHHFEMARSYSAWGLGIVWCALLFAVGISAVLSFVPFSSFLKNPNRGTLLPCLFIVFTFPLYMNCFEFLWRDFGFLTSLGLEKVFKLFFLKAVAVSRDPNGYLIIENPALKILIGQGCVGFDGLFLFTFVSNLLLLLRESRFTKLGWTLVYFTGAVLMYFVNLLRITLLFWSGVWCRMFFGFQEGTVVFKTVVHTHLGWMLYLGFVISYFSFAFFVSSKMTLLDFFHFRQREMV